MAQKGLYPHQIIEVLAENVNTLIEFDTYENYEEIVSVEATAINGDAEKLNSVFVKLNVSQHEFFGETGVPVKFLEPNTYFPPGQRGYRFSDFRGDAPTPKGKAGKAKIYVVAPSETDAFTKIRFLFTYKGKTE